MPSTKQSIEMSLKRSEQRAHRHWYQDGLAEMAVGIYFLLLALLFYTEYVIEGANISALGLPLITLGGIFGIAPIVRRVKAHLTYPRTGFVRYNEPSVSRRWFVLTLGLVIGVAVGVLVATIQPLTDIAEDLNTRGEQIIFNWLPLAQATLLTIILGFTAYRFSLFRYYIVAAISLVAGIVVMSLGDVLGTAIYLTIMFLTLVASGLITLRNFLRQTHSYQADV